MLGLIDGQMLRLYSLLATFANSRVDLRLVPVTHGITSLYGGYIYMILFLYIFLVIFNLLL